MFLFISEDGTIEKSLSYTDENLSWCDDGVLQIIDITKPDAPTEYFMGKWVNIHDTQINDEED